MRPVLRALVCLCLPVGCARAEFPEPCTPGPIPPIGQHQLAPPGDAEAGDDTDDPKAEVAKAPEARGKGKAEADAGAKKAEADAEGAEPESEDGGAEPESEDGEAEAEAEEDEAEPESEDGEAEPESEDGGAEPESEDGEADVEAEPEPEPEGDEAEAEAEEDEAEPAATPDDRLAAFEAARDDMQRSADWLLCVLPETHPDAWLERRDLVMDWIEYHPTLGYTFSASIMEPIHKDKRFRVSMYMNLAYAIGKARYLMSADPVDPIEAEVAALETVALYYATFKAADPKLEARKLGRLLRKKKKGKLRPWIAKALGGG